MVNESESLFPRNLNPLTSKIGASCFSNCKIDTVKSCLLKTEKTFFYTSFPTSAQDSRNFYLLDVYDNCDGDRDVELVDPTPVLNLKRKEGKRPAILIGLRDNENDSGVIKVRSIDPRLVTHSEWDS